MLSLSVLTLKTSMTLFRNLVELEKARPSLRILAFSYTQAQGRWGQHEMSLPVQLVWAVISTQGQEIERCV